MSEIICFSIAVYKFLLDWQTLLAGIVALTGALLTIRAIREQLTFEKVKILVSTTEKVCS